MVHVERKTRGREGRGGNEIEERKSKETKENKRKGETWCTGMELSTLSARFSILLDVGNTLFIDHKTLRLFVYVQHPVQTMTELGHLHKLVS